MLRPQSGVAAYLALALLCAASGLLAQPDVSEAGVGSTWHYLWVGVLLLVGLGRTVYARHMNTLGDGDPNGARRSQRLNGGAIKLNLSSRVMAPSSGGSDEFFLMAGIPRRITVSQSQSTAPYRAPKVSQRSNLPMNTSPPPPERPGSLGAVVQRAMVVGLSTRATSFPSLTAYSIPGMGGVAVPTASSFVSVPAALPSGGGGPGPAGGPGPGPGPGPAMGMGPGPAGPGKGAGPGGAGKQTPTAQAQPQAEPRQPQDQPPQRQQQPQPEQQQQRQRQPLVINETRVTVLQPPPANGTARTTRLFSGVSDASADTRAAREAAAESTIRAAALKDPAALTSGALAGLFTGLTTLDPGRAISAAGTAGLRAFLANPANLAFANGVRAAHNLPPLTAAGSPAPASTADGAGTPPPPGPSDASTPPPPTT